MEDEGREKIDECAGDDEGCEREDLVPVCEEWAQEEKCRGHEDGGEEHACDGLKTGGAESERAVLAVGGVDEEDAADGGAEGGGGGEADVAPFNGKERDGEDVEARVEANGDDGNAQRRLHIVLGLEPGNEGFLEAEEAEAECVDGEGA